MKRLSTLTALILALAIALTGCVSSGNGNSDVEADPLDVTVAPKGFTFDLPDGTGLTGAEDIIRPSDVSMLFQAGESRLVYTWMHITPAAANTFSEAAGEEDHRKFAQQYAGGMDEFQSETVTFGYEETVDGGSAGVVRNALRLTATLAEDFGQGKAGENAVVLLVPLDEYLVQFEGYGPDAAALVDGVFSSMAYNPTEPEASEAPDAPDGDADPEEAQ